MRRKDNKLCIQGKKAKAHRVVGPFFVCGKELRIGRLHEEYAESVILSPHRITTGVGPFFVCAEGIQAC